MIMIIINLFLYLELDHKNISIFYRIDKITSKKRLIVIGDWAMGDRAMVASELSRVALSGGRRLFK